MMTCADELWLAMTFWVVRFVHWSSNSQCVSHSAALCRNLSCQDTDVFSTTCWGQNGIWQTQLGTNSDLGLRLDTDTCIVHKQTNKDCALRATINSDRSATSGVWHKQGEKQPRRRVASATRKNNLVNVAKYTNLITLLDLCVSSKHSPNTVTRRSHNSKGHGVASVNMVVTGCSSQQKQRKKRNSDVSVMKIVFWRTSEAKKSRKKKNKKPLENNEKGQRKKCKDSYFLTWELSFQKKKNTKKREMQGMSCGRDQWQQNAHGPNSLHYVTTRSNSQESLRARARSSTHVDFKRLPRNDIWTKTLLLQRQLLWKECLFKTTKKGEKGFSKKIKQISFFFEKRISKKNSKND